LLVVHGTLHLLGYDHDTPERRAQMWGAQARALTTLGIPLDYVPALENLTDDGHG
ncbi:MAG: rRNA maturation RNAse YbeY, partial [Anaerolineae bacterium]|nr:rRNA maturation RNAse YbeY [Anaerolineae bacterium]